MKCWKSASNTQGSRLIVALQVGAVKIYAATVERPQKEMKDRVKLSLPQKLRSPTIEY
jgi:hypothetical protein